jgi:hypothetical protein
MDSIYYFYSRQRRSLKFRERVHNSGRLVQRVSPQCSGASTGRSKQLDVLVMDLHGSYKSEFTVDLRGEFDVVTYEDGEEAEVCARTMQEMLRNRVD